MSIQDVRAANQAKLAQAAAEATDAQLAEALKAGWAAIMAKYCPNGDCEYPETGALAAQMIDDALQAGERAVMIGVSNVDDGQYPPSQQSVDKMELFNSTVIGRLNAFKQSAGGSAWVVGAAALGLFLLLRK